MRAAVHATNLRVAASALMTAAAPARKAARGDAFGSDVRHFGSCEVESVHMNTKLVGVQRRTNETEEPHRNLLIASSSRTRPSHSHVASEDHHR